MLHDLPPLPPIRKTSSNAKSYEVKNNDNSEIINMPGQLTDIETENVPRPKTTERRTNIGATRCVLVLGGTMFEV